MTSEFPHTPPRKSYTFSDAVNADIRRAAATVASVRRCCDR